MNNICDNVQEIMQAFFQDRAVNKINFKATLHKYLSGTTSASVKGIFSKHAT